MTMHIRQSPVVLRTRELLARLNGPWHERALWLYMIIVLAHWVEHLAQAYQIYVLGWARPVAGGALGLWQPWLVRSELLHWGYAFFMLVGLMLLGAGCQGRSRWWWNLSLGIQLWHFFEHSLLQIQAIAGGYWFGGTVPTSIGQLWVPRVELHLLYNAAVFLPMVIAVYYHLYPPSAEPVASCGCARSSKASSYHGPQVAA
jgi:hypothetical protein